MQWRIINDRRAIVGMSCDKLASKEYAREVALSAGVNLEVPTTYWVGTDVRELQAMAGNLPVRWVLKPNHTSGRYALIDADRSAVDWERLQSLGQKWIQRDEEELGLGHWGYSVARHLLFAEERIGSHESPTTIRGFTTNGEPRWFNADVGLKPHKRRWRHNADFERNYSTSEADKTTGIPSPIELMGDSGLCFRLRWATRDGGNAWCGSGPTGEWPEEVSAVNRATGVHFAWGQDRKSTRLNSSHT